MFSSTPVANQIKSHLIVALLFLGLASFGVNHKYASAFILFLLLIAVLDAFFDRKSWREVSVDWPILFTLISIPLFVFISSILMHDFELRYFDNPLRFIFAFIIFLLIIKSNLPHVFFLHGFAAAAILIGIFLSLDYDGGARYAGNYRNPIPLGNVAASLTVITGLISLEKTQTHNIRVAYFVAALLAFSALVGSMSVGSWTAFVLTLVIVSLIFSDDRFSSSIKTLVFLSVLLFLAFLFSDLVQERIQIIWLQLSCVSIDPWDQCSTNSLRDRFWFYLIGVDAFWNAPLLGHGPDAARSILSDAVSKGFIPIPGSFSHFHNDLIELLVTRGLVGVAGYLLYVFGLLWFSVKLIKRYDDNLFARLLFTNTLIFIFCGLTQAVLSHASTATYFAFSNALLLALAMKFQKNHNEASDMC